MKKLLAVTLIAFTMATWNLTPVYADGHKGGSNCGKCSSEKSKCKVKKLKKEMSLYWAYKDELKMSDDQLMKIADIKHAAMKQLYLESAEMKAIKVDVKTELWASQIDVSKVNPLIDAKYAAKAKLSKTYVKALADAQAVLSDGQRADLREIKTDRYLEKSGIRGSDCSCNQCSMSAKHA